MKTSSPNVNTQKINLEINNYSIINGIRIKSNNKTEIISPIDNHAIADLFLCDEKQINEAVAFAKNAFENGDWSDIGISQRKKILFKYADLLEENRKELALLDSLETGKPITYSFEHDMLGAIRCIRYYAEAIDKVYGQIAPTDSQSLALISHEPLGVIGAILPWNFPQLMLAWKMGPILAAGNSLIIKPSEKASLSTIKAVELAIEAGIPKSVLHVVTGLGSEAGKVLACHNDIDAIAFTGSTVTGKKLLEYAGQSNMKRVFLETGGKSANIIFDDLYDLDKAAKTAADGIFYNQGQVCIAASRLLLQKGIADQFIEKLKYYAQQYVPSNPLNDNCNMGTLIDEAHCTKVSNMIQEAIDEGAKVYLDGRNAGINQIGPTILGTEPNSKIATQEIFGPVLSIIIFEHEDEAIKIANNTIFGLGAALWSADINKAHRVSKKLKAGSVFVNNYNDGDMTVPWAGFKQSGNGCDKSLIAMEKFTQLKTTWIDLSE